MTALVPLSKIRKEKGAGKVVCTLQAEGEKKMYEMSFRGGVKKIKARRESKSVR